MRWSKLLSRFHAECTAKDRELSHQEAVRKALWLYDATEEDMRTEMQAKKKAGDFIEPGLNKANIPPIN